METIERKRLNFIVDGEWNNWSEWSSCSVTCSNGTRFRSRHCKPAVFGGKNCSGSANETGLCFNTFCPGIK